MIKKVTLLGLGFGLIAAGIAGISMSVVEKKGKDALKQMEKLQQENQSAAAEEWKKIEEKRQEVEKLAAGVEAEKRRVREEQRRAQEELRAREANLARKKLEMPGTKAASSQTAGEKGKKGKATKTTLASKDSGKKQGTAAASGRSRSVKASKARDEDGFRWISRKAGAEAARISRPVKYHNLRTRELVLAEPLDYGPHSVRVRIRVWKDQRLIKDTTITISEDALRGPGPTRHGRGRDFA
ncbi:MAG TPA: hypothetical protein PLM79_00510 [Syntrophobacteraceae bacterium]|nr:hypothetical protein [Syntrophobacteraceae bacterium]